MKTRTTGLDLDQIRYIGLVQHELRLLKNVTIEALRLSPSFFLPYHQSGATAYYAAREALDHVFG